MKRRTILRVLGFSLLLLLALYSCSECFGSITVSALSDGRFLTSEEALQVLGTSITVTYYDGDDYVTTEARYTSGTRQLQSAVGDLPAGTSCLQYTTSGTVINTNPLYVTLEMHPNYQIIDTQQLHTAVFVWSDNNATSPPYTSPNWEWFIGGQRHLFECGLENDNTTIPKVVVGVDNCFYCPVDLYSQNTFSAYSSKCTFAVPVQTFGGSLYIYLAVPYVSGDAYGINGTTTNTTTGQNQGEMDVSGVVSGISETNDILEEHSGLLADIIDFLHYIGETIAGDESEVSDVEPIETAENPPDWDDAMSQVESALDDIPDMTASGGFIWALYNTIMTTSPVIKFLVPFGLILTLLSYIWWKK